MKITPRFWKFLFALGVCAATFAQQDPPPRDGNGPPPFGPGGGPPFGPPGPQAEIKLLKKFDKDGDKFLTGDERKAALDHLQAERARRPRRGMRPFGGEDGEAPKLGKKISPADVKNYPDAPLYDPNVLRTVFIEFDSPNWEKEMAAFNNTDVEMPAKVTIDGKTYRDVGVHFRGASSFGMIPEGKKRPLDLVFDHKNKDQTVGGYREMELLNSHEDPSFLRTVLSYDIARQYLPAAKANFVRVVINGENWGVYINKQASNKDFIRDNFKTTKGNRWKTPGSPRGQATLKYLGDDVESYKGIYQLKSKDDPKAWADLVRFTKTLNQTPAEKLEAELSPILDIDGALRFLALENALVNNDGYWVRTSDYSMYQDEKGIFHILPYDSNETMGRAMTGPPGGGGRFRGPPGNSNQPPPDRLRDGPRPAMDMRNRELDPLFAANDESKPLISKLLAALKLRERYLGYVREIAEKSLDWEKVGPVAQKYHDLIAEDVREDTRKLDSTEEFEKNLTEDIAGNGRPGPFGGSRMGLKKFFEERRAYLLKATARN
ncbi:MAG TPA: CotH kinase family protein [Verrucomicrobiae bacterium]|nr:CotH kinase family protein [Verrucomicrobiae bacterium]